MSEMSETETWPDNRCGHCGARRPQGDDDPWLRYECPECGREGCPECLPAGVGCPCPECEERGA